MVQEIHESRVKGARESGSFEARIDALETAQKNQRSVIGGLVVSVASMILGWVFKR